MDFMYRGRDHQGSLQQGNIHANNRDSAVISLQNQGIIVTQLKVVENNSLEKKLSFRLFEKKISDNEIILFTRQLYTLSKSGIPIIRALNGLAESASNMELKRILMDISQSLVSGSDLASSFKCHDNIFSSIYISMIHLGEATGKLDDALLKLISHLEMEKETRKRIKSALRYPVMVIVSMMIAMVVITMFVIPGFSSVFNKLGEDLPIATRILVYSSDFMQDNGLVIFGLFIFSGISFRRYIKTESGGLYWDQKKLKIPFIGSIFERIALARFSRSFAMMMSAGVPVLQSLSVISASVGNRFIGQAIQGMQSGVERGERLTNTASASGLFTPLVLQMMAVGEETGSVDQLLDEVADFYEQEVDYDLKQLADSIEPLLLAFLGVLILILALGVFLPIWELSSAAR